MDKLQYVPVHCCCTPSLKLGSIGLVPSNIRLGPIRFMVGCEWYTKEVDQFPLEFVDLEVAWLYLGRCGTHGGEKILAIKTNHVPLEKLRRLPTFREDV